jgi:O-antigen/teichoic acid export membrane protein
MNPIIRNILSNIIGGGWSMLLSLLAIPIQLRILGAEAYGLIGFVVSFQVILVIFDLGLTTTITREVAIDQDPQRTFSQSLIQTSSTIYWIASLILAFALILSADWIALHWLNAQSLSLNFIAHILRLLSLYIVFIWPLNIYISTLAGLQRFEILNTLKFLNASFTQVGGIIVLLVTHQLEPFVLWLVFNAFVFLLAHIWVCRQLLPSLSLKPFVSREVIKKVWRFSLDMNLISTLAIIYIQSDRLLISALLPLQNLGYYNAAYNIGRQISTIQEFLNGAIMPTLSTKAQQNPLKELEKFYVQYAQMLVYILVPPACLMIFFAYPLLELWAGSHIADNSAIALSILATGFLLNGSLTTNYTLAVATGHSRLILWTNIAIFLVYIPGIVFLITSYGIIGAAIAWLLLNLYYLVVLMPLTQRYILNSTMRLWITQILLPFLSIGGLVFSTGAVINQSVNLGSFLGIFLVCCAIYMVTAFWLLKTETRSYIFETSRRLLLKISVL